MEALKLSKLHSPQRSRPLTVEARKPHPYFRQGAWFFIAAPHLHVSDAAVLHDESLGGGHVAEFCVRVRGETMYLSRRHPSGLREKEYRALLARDLKARRWHWQAVQRSPRVYVRGRVRHADHPTIELPFWHRVVTSTEDAAGATRVALLD